MPKTHFDDLEKVGPEKPLGYLPLSTIKDDNLEDPEELVKSARAKGQWAEIFSAQESRVGSGALYVADLAALTEVLTKNAVVLQEAGWPTDPVKFIAKVRTETAPAGTKLFDVIADAFADKTNPLRSDAEKVDK